MARTENSWVNLSLTDFQKLSYAEDMPHDSDMIYLLDELVLQGFKVTFGSNQQGAGFYAAVTDKQVDGVNTKTTMTTWGGSVEKAFATVYWALRTAESKGMLWVDFKKEMDKDAEIKAQDFKERFFKDLASRKK